MFVNEFYIFLWWMSAKNTQRFGFLNSKSAYDGIVPIVSGIAVRARDSRSHASEENGKISCVKYYWRPANAGESRWGWRGIRSSRLDGTRECAREWHATGSAERLTREIKNRVRIFFSSFLPPSLFSPVPCGRETPALPRCVTVRDRRLDIGFKYRREIRINESCCFTRIRFTVYLAYFSLSCSRKHFSGKNNITSLINKYATSW